MPQPIEHPPECCSRLSVESATAHAAFSAYLAQGSDRSIRAVARELGKSASLIGRWSSRFGWSERATSYDRYLDGRRRHEREETLLELERRHAASLAGGRTALMQPVTAFLERTRRIRESDGDPFEDVSMAELLQMAVTSARHLPALIQAERLVAGVSTVNLNARANVTVEARRQADAMTRQELDSYLAGLDGL